MNFVDNFKEIPWESLNDILVVPIMSSHFKHRIDNRLSFIYIKDLISLEEYVIGINHNDLITNDISFIKEVDWPVVYSYDKYVLEDHGIKCYDLGVCKWIDDNNQLDIKFNTTAEKYYRWFWKEENVNDFVPIVGFIEYCRYLASQLPINIDMKVLNFYNQMSDNFKGIEDYGIPIDFDVLNNFYDSDNTGERFYSKYHMTVSPTGRPSNHFNNVNFAALNKKNGVRKMIIPTPGNILIDFDYDSYHVNLITKMIGYEFEDTNLHEHLGKLYFGLDTLTPEEYEESKNVTFRLLYGEIPIEARNLEFFAKVHQFRIDMWNEFQKNGFVKMPISGRKVMKKNLENMNAHKLFNYISQGQETEMNSLVLTDVLEYLYKKKSELILYTYDSFLFNYNPADGKQSIYDLLNIITKFGMPVSLKTGMNYQDMQVKDF